MLKLELSIMDHTSCTHLVCMRLESMLQGALGVTGTGMPCCCILTKKPIKLSTQLIGNVETYQSNIQLS